MFNFHVTESIRDKQHRVCSKKKLMASCNQDVILRGNKTDGKYQLIEHQQPDCYSKLLIETDELRLLKYALISFLSFSQ